MIDECELLKWIDMEIKDARLNGDFVDRDRKMVYLILIDRFHVMKELVRSGEWRKNVIK
jgi:hypothetical protein